MFSNNSAITLQNHAEGKKMVDLKYKTDQWTLV